MFTSVYHGQVGTLEFSIEKSVPAVSHVKQLELIGRHFKMNATDSRLDLHRVKHSHDIRMTKDLLLEAGKHNPGITYKAIPQAREE